MQQRHAVVTFERGARCILPWCDDESEYQQMIDFALQPVVGPVRKVVEYTWQDAPRKASALRIDTGSERPYDIYVDNICGKVVFAGGVDKRLLPVAVKVNPSFHFGVKHKFLTVHGQYMLQHDHSVLVFKGVKDITAVVKFINKLAVVHMSELGGVATSKKRFQQPYIDMISVSCEFFCPLVVSMESLLHTLLTTVLSSCITTNARSDEDTQQMHFKITDWDPFLQCIQDGNMCESDTFTDAPCGPGLFFGLSRDDVHAISTTSVSVNANAVFKVRFTWAERINCREQRVVEGYARLASALCLVLLGKIGAV